MNRSRGVIVTNAEINPAPEFMFDCFGSNSSHGNDYSFYYNNINDNLAKRIATYKDEQ